MASLDDSPFLRQKISTRPPKGEVSPGVSRARRPKTGSNKGMLILLNEEEKMSIKKSAAKEGVSISRFVVEQALNAAKRVLSQTA
jgi:hypothetical protein